MPEEYNIQEDEINLLDLFVVLLRYRKLIISLTLITIFLIFIGYFIYPSYKQKELLDQKYIVGSMTIALNPSLLEYFPQEDPIKEIAEIFKTPELVLNSIEKNGLADLLSIEDYPDARKQAIVKDRLTDVENTPVQWDEHNWEYNVDSPWVYGVSLQHNSVKISLLMDLQNKEKNNLFLKTLFDEVNASMLSLIESVTQAKVSNYELLLTSDIPRDTLNSIFGDYSTAKAVLDGKMPALVYISAPHVYIEGPNLSIEKLHKSYIKMGIILIMAVFFLSLFLAFILEFITNIKQDEERMNKIREALGKK